MAATPHNPTVVCSGYFNPIRLAHVQAALDVQANPDKTGYYGTAKVLFLPVAFSIYGKPPFSIEHRINMIRLAIEGFSGLDVLCIDAGAKAAKQNSQKLAELRQKGIYPQYWLLGSDNYINALVEKQGLDKLITEGVSLIVNQREGYNAISATRGYDGIPIEVKGVDLEKKVRLLNGTRLGNPTSSTRVRQLISEGGDASMHLHPRVHAYIREHSLYRQEEGAKQLMAASAQQQLRIAG